MAEMSETETTFLDTNIYKGEKYKAIQFLMCVRTSNLLKHFNIRTSLRATHQGSKKASPEQTLLKKIFEEQIQNLKSCLREGSYPENVDQRTISEVQFETGNWYSLPFVTQYHQAVSNFKQILMKDSHLREQLQLLKEIYKDPPLICYKRGRSIKGILVRAKL